MQPLTNEHQFVERAKQGDQEAVSQLYEAYAETIFQYISYRVSTDTIAEDLTAEVFLRMVRGLPHYQYTGAPLGAWLFKIASNQVTDYYRKNRHMTAEPISENYQSDDTDPFDTMAKQEERARLRLALQTLSEDYQNIIILRFMKNVSYPELAEIMNKTEGAIRVLQHRALKALTTAMEGLEGGISL